MNMPFISCLNKQASTFFKVNAVAVKIYKKNIHRVLLWIFCNEADDEYKNVLNIANILSLLYIKLQILESLWSITL